jgi:hypothetical protein
MKRASKARLSKARRKQGETQARRDAKDMEDMEDAKDHKDRRKVTLRLLNSAELTRTGAEGVRLSTLHTARRR